MSLLVLIPLSIGMGMVGLCAFIWALRHDQFEDLTGNAERVLIPDQHFNDTEPFNEGTNADHVKPDV
ncbi:cbb3-type cytochrome oxidase assembly protein CcoS [Roseovarius arcticus]|uniref:cbb3-type cytochrome oxidase assembly protein CcoS n=1 Tax=Roseovarius arcticus TaxID=2547404 RepID=UPI001110BDAC|nr:cbb3-type cytochrome oxidase assembly protein CcoS [Roseovarius arcticus]